MSTEVVRLTQTVAKGGCAAKIAATTLRRVLSNLDLPTQGAGLLVGNHTFDDAGVFQLTDDLALVETVDFFTPIVDTPYLFGKIAAANALSDVYAMGGVPKTALAILAFPLMSLDEKIMQEVLRGAGDSLRQAQALLVGGHSIDDDTLKFGLAVTGLVHPQKIWSNAGAQVGDELILIKALGTGTLTAALKRSFYTEEDIAEAITSMMTLNNIFDVLSAEDLGHIHAATDITGFGLAGHSWQMAKASQVSMSFSLPSLPLLEKAATALQEGYLTKAHKSNREYTQDHLQFQGDWQEWQKLIFFDPQTSGGLLLSVSAGSSEEMLKKLKEKFPRAQKIGKVLPAQGQAKIHATL